jgi:hypothetical protein
MENLKHSGPPKTQSAVKDEEEITRQVQKLLELVVVILFFPFFACTLLHCEKGVRMPSTFFSFFFIY